VRFWTAFYSEDKEKPKCPVEENGNCGKSPPTNARKNCGKTDIRTNSHSIYRAVFERKVLCEGFRFLRTVSFFPAPAGSCEVL
jgi:hypothetical protein